jgi:hypothetical protein
MAYILPPSAKNERRIDHLLRRNEKRTIACSTRISENMKSVYLLTMFTKN